MARVRAGKLLCWMGVGAVGLGALTIMGLRFTQAIVLTVPNKSANHRPPLVY